MLSIEDYRSLDSDPVMKKQYTAAKETGYGLTGIIRNALRGTSHPHY
jgi:hypothetical protein